MKKEWLSAAPEITALEVNSDLAWRLLP